MAPSSEKPAAAQKAGKAATGAPAAASTPEDAPKRKRHRPRIHKKRKSALSTGSVKNEINVTPLVDVVLVLLIIFMVVTPMLSRGAKVELPETHHHEKKNDTGEQVVVSVTPDGKVWVDADMVEGEQVVEAVKAALRKKASEVHVKADKHLAYGDVRKVLEKIHEAGAPTVALGTDEPKKEGGK